MRKRFLRERRKRRKAYHLMMIEEMMQDFYDHLESVLVINIFEN